MKKILIILFVCLFVLINGLTFCMSQDLDNKALDDIERSFKDMERSMKQDPLKNENIKFQEKYQFPQQKIKALTQDLTVKDQPATDRAIIRNQERWKELMEGPKTSLSEGLDDWGQDVKIPKEYRLIIELFAIALSLSLITFMLYRRKFKKQQKKKPEEDKDKNRDLFKRYKNIYK